MHDIAAWLPLIVIADALGVREEDRALLLGWSEDMMSMLGQKSDEAMQRATAAGMAYYQYAARVIAERREAPSDDLMSILVNAEVDGVRLHDGDIVSESLLILNGGDETTRHVISGGVYQLLADPTNWEALRSDRSLLPVAIEEMLRWVSPIKNMARTATVDTELAGQRISAGDTLLLLYSSANRDERVFADPFRFDIAGPRTTTSRSASVPTSVSVPASPASNSPSSWTGSSIVCPIWPSSTTRSRRTGRPTSSAVTNGCPFVSARAGPHDLPRVRIAPRRTVRPAPLSVRCVNLTSMSITVGSMTVEGKSFIVTGGGSGIGAA